MVSEEKTLLTVGRASRRMTGTFNTRSLSPPTHLATKSRLCNSCLGFLRSMEIQQLLLQSAKGFGISTSELQGALASTAKPSQETQHAIGLERMNMNYLSSYSQ